MQTQLMMTIHHHYQYLHHQHYSKLPFSEICSSLLAAAGDDALSTHQTQVGFVAVFPRRGFAHFDGFEPGGAELELVDAAEELGLGKNAEKGVDLGSGYLFWTVNLVGSSETVSSTMEPRLHLQKHPLGRRT